MTFTKFSFRMPFAIIGYLQLLIINVHLLLNDITVVVMQELKVGRRNKKRRGGGRERDESK